MTESHQDVVIKMTIDNSNEELEESKLELKSEPVDVHLEFVLDPSVNDDGKIQKAVKVDDSGLNFTCHVCAVQCENAGLLENHVKQVHDIQKFDCDFCEECFR